MASTLEKHYPLKEAADYVGLKPRSLRRYCVREEIDGAYQRNRRWYIPASALQVFQQKGARPARRK